MAKINVAFETVAAAAEKLLAGGQITQDGHDIIIKYYEHCRNQNWSQERASKEIKRQSWTTLYRVWNGTYGAAYDSVIAAMSRVLDMANQRSKLASVDYIETSTYETISAVLTNALIGQEISTINGNSQIGKTSAISHYINRHPELRTIYIRTPSCPSRIIFLDALRRACFLARNTNITRMRESIKAAVDSRTLLIIDEAHQIFLNTDKSAVYIIEFLREIFDETRCGLVLVGTNVLSTELTRGRQSRLYSQLMMRGLIHAQLPDSTPTADIKLGASRFNYPPQITTEARKIINDINSTNGFGVLLKTFKAGASLAKNTGVKLTWDHFVEAWIVLEKLSRKNNEEEE